jgi:hypothetical protein
MEVETKRNLVLDLPVLTRGCFGECIYVASPCRRDASTVGWMVLSMPRVAVAAKLLPLRSAALPVVHTSMR